MKNPLDVGKFPIATRTINILRGAGIESTEDFSNLTLAQLKDLPGLGSKLLTELRLFLKDAGVKLKKAEAKQTTPKYPKETKEILKNLLGERVNNYAMEMKRCGLMILHFGVETMEKFQVHDGKDSLCYYFSGGKISPWVDNYAKQFMTFRMSEKVPLTQDADDELENDKALPAEFVPIKTMPKSLADFLKER